MNTLFKTKHVQLQRLVQVRALGTINDKRKPRNKQKEQLERAVKMTPHVMMAGAFLATGGLHWLYLNRHFQKMTLYYDLHQLSKNPNVVATYGKVREVLLTHPEFRLYMNQPADGNTDTKDLIIENPIFQPFSFKTEGLQGRLDEKRRRFQFDCAFRDISKDSEGTVQTLVVFNEKNEAYFESFTVFLTRPVERTVRIQETDIEDSDELIAKFNKPRVKVVEPQPRTNPQQDKYRQY